VSRKAQELDRTAAAVYVITREDIRRSGATTLPDVLRMAPGVSVSELAANTWSVTARGFGGVNANKLLVLIDGRSIYTPLNGGVSWEMQMLPLDAIEQVEVIRGPGGSLWGANAINGVINIITQSADLAQGARVQTRVSRYEPGTFDVAYGGAFGSSAHYVASGRYFQRSTPGTTAGFPHGDDSEAYYGRTRIDWGAGADKFSLQSDAERGQGTQVQQVLSLNAPYRNTVLASPSFSGFSSNLTWKRSHSSRADSSLQAYYTSSTHSHLQESYHITGGEVKHHRALGERHDLVLGTEYRFIDSWVGGNGLITLRPSGIDSYVATSFVQDEVALSKALTITGGVKLGHDSVPGLELQPSGRVLWTVSAQHSVWGAVSRVVRPPNRFERGMHVITAVSPGPGGLPVVVTLDGSPDTSTESIAEVEAGYRAQYRTFSVDVTAFKGNYFNLTGLERGTAAPAMELGTPVVRIPLTAVNGGRGDTHGVEAAAAWKPAARWHVAGHYAFLDVKFDDSDRSSSSAVPINGPTPRHQFHLRTFVDLSRNVEASALLFRAGAISPLNIPAATRLDLQAAWSLSSDLKVVGGVRSLLHGDAAEYADRTASVIPTPVRPNPYAEVRWKF